MRLSIKFLGQCPTIIEAYQISVPELSILQYSSILALYLFKLLCMSGFMLGPGEHAHGLEN